MIETQEKICDWADATFGPAAYLPRMFARANEEMAELIKGLTQIHALSPAVYDPAPLATECAGVVIVLCRAARASGGIEDLLAFTSGVKATSDLSALPTAIHAASMLLDAMERLVMYEDEITSSRIQGYLLLVVTDLAKVCSAIGQSLPDAIDRKMAINRGREWKLDHTGHGHHV